MLPKFLEFMKSYGTDGVTEKRSCCAVLSLGMKDMPFRGLFAFRGQAARSYSNTLMRNVFFGRSGLPARHDFPRKRQIDACFAQILLECLHFGLEFPQILVTIPLFSATNP